MSYKMSCAEALAAPPPDMPTKKIVHVVAAALVDRKKRILVAQRPAGRPWPDCGISRGKIEAGEIPEYALMRELREELGIETRPCGMWPIGFASHNYPEFHLVMPLFAIRVWSGEPQSVEGQALKWVSVQDLYGLEMPEADKPLIPQLEALI